jgi:NAD(P)-dependent dehydrogenase (short-subunit alcohol dehydrogenase family)
MATFVPPVPAAQSSPLTVLITGTSRGIGLEMVRQYASAFTGNVVIAAARTPSPALTALAKQHSNVHIVTLDVSDEDSIRASLPQVEAVTTHLDLLVNNAGIHGPDDGRHPLKATKAQLADVFNTNVIGAVLVTQAYLPLLLKSSAPKVVNVGSTMGSNVNAAAFGKMYVSLTYGTSKAALAYATTVFRFAAPTVTFLCVHPGWIDTDMGSGTVMGKAPDTAHDSVQAFRHHVAEKKLDNSGEFVDITTGKAVPF